MAIDQIKSHFEEETEKYDVIIRRLIPHYSEMIEALVCAIPFKKDFAGEMIDLGCGTGTVLKAVRGRFSQLEVTCVDIAENMLEIARVKIGGNMRCVQADFNSFEFDRSYNLIISSLALQHLESDEDKLGFYKKIYSALNSGGIFINIDVVFGGSDDIQKMYMGNWVEFMQGNVFLEEIEGKRLPNYYAEDRPAKLVTHLDMLKTCGFGVVDVIYKYYNYAVYFGQK